MAELYRTLPKHISTWKRLLKIIKNDPDWDKLKYVMLDVIDENGLTTLHYETEFIVFMASLEH